MEPFDRRFEAQSPALAVAVERGIGPGDEAFGRVARLELRQPEGDRAVVVCIGEERAT